MLEKNIICPKCKKQLIKTNNTYKCLNNHSFDVSKEGYVNLLLSKTNAGDNDILIKARHNFLTNGYYEPLVNKLKEIIYKLKPNSLLDAGCGTGYYTSKLKDIVPNIIGCDISKDAIKLASKKNKDITFIVASNQSIPLKNNSIDLILNIFAPHFNNEFNRILDNGYLIIVHTAEKHLWELKELIYDEPYLNKKETYHLENFYLIDEQEINYKIDIPKEDLYYLFTMTPYYYKTRKEDISKIDNIDSLNITINFTISIFKQF